MNPLIQLEKICLVCVAVLACYGLSAAVNANTITVTNKNDSGPGSLRSALAIANDGDTIDARDVSGTILLTTGELKVRHSVSITGPGAAHLAINGNATSRVFHNFASNVTISRFTITNGRSDDGGGILNGGGSTPGTMLTVLNCVISNNGAGFGGGIWSFGPLAVTNSVISGNSASESGGGIWSGGERLTISNSTISSNQSSGCYGGGIFLSIGPRLRATVINSTISGNSMVNPIGFCNIEPLGGGGIAFNGSGTLIITNSTISDNHADRFTDIGGGIYMVESNVSVTITNSTISGNSSGAGGGIASTCPDGGCTGTFAIENSTFSGNSAPVGGSISFQVGGTIGDTVLNAGPSGGTIFNSPAITSLGYNLASDGGGGVLTGPGDQINTHPLLGPLRDNGGPTFTHALLPGSPAINAGNPNFTPPPSFDQRGPGYPRVVNGRIDIGSFEVQITPTPTPTHP